MLLPLAYVAVPYLLGVLSVRGSVTAIDLLLLAGFYAGFIGRIVLKDFRDVRGDALFGKRTFLVRHGRRATCVLSAVFLVADVTVLPFVRDVTVALAGAYVTYMGASLLLLRALARSTSARHDELLVSAIAILGRGMLVTLYAHFAIVAAGWSAAAATALIVVLAAVVLGTTRDMLRHGPRSRSFVPPAWAEEPVAGEPDRTLDSPAPVS
jgi:4-hydroxybenzoate polyprenyltransferase